MLKGRRGFTIVELLIVVAILSVMAALLFPVFAAVRLEAKTTDSKAKLHNIFLALTLYRSDWGGTSDVGDLPELGIPSTPQLVKSAGWLGLGPEGFTSGCATHLSILPHKEFLFYYPGEGGPKFVQASATYGDGLVMVVDNQCNAADVNVHNVYRTKRGLGVLLSGTLIDRTAQGDPYDPAWYATH